MDAALQPDLTHQLPRGIYYQVVHALRDALPPPVTGSPEDRIRRDNAIIATVASLCPANTAEVILASQFVAANAQALDCLRLARLHPNDAPHVLKCTAQSASMMRRSRGALGQLLRLQAARERASRITAHAIRRTRSSQPPHVRLPMRWAARRPRRNTRPKSRNLAKAGNTRSPTRSAALIRSLGRLPKKFDDGMTSPELVHEIVNGDSPILQALVKKPPHRLGAAA